MKSGRKKEKIVNSSTMSSPVGMVPGNVGNGIGMPSSSSGTAGGVSSAPLAKQEKPLYNACPPPPNLYGPPSATPQPAVPSYSEKAKKGGSGGGGAVPSSGNSSDGEKKGRRRPGRKSRQVSDSSGFPPGSSDSSVPLGKAEGSVGSGSLSQEIKKQMNTSSQLSSPNPSSMPNPNFKTKPVHEVSSHSSFVAKSASRSEPKNVDQSRAEQVLVKSNFHPEQGISSSLKSSILRAPPPLDASCTVESGGGQKVKNKDTFPTGIPRSKSKDASKKSNVGTCLKKSGSLGVDSKQSSQKGWRMCAPPCTNSNICSGSFDVLDSSEISCASGEGVGGVSPPEGCLLQYSHSWPESVLAAPAIYMSGPPDKLVNSGNAGNGLSTSRSSHFSEHLSINDATHSIEAGLAFRGVVRVNPHYRSEAYVAIEGVPVDILIDGFSSQNRAMEGDVVAVQLNPASQWLRLKGTNNKQSSTLGVEDSSIRVTIPAENEVRHAIADTMLEHELVGPMECFSIPSWDSSIQENEERMTLAGSPSTSLDEILHRHCEIGSWIDPMVTKQGSSELDIDGQPTNPQVGHAKGTGSRNEVARHGNMDPDRSLSKISVLKLATLVESLPGKRPTGRVVAIIGRSMRREAVIGFLEVQGSNCGGERGNISGSDFSPQKAGKKQTTKGGGGMVTFIPVDNRFSKMVVFGSGIPEQLSKRIKDGDPTVGNELVVAQVEGWKADSALPRASVKQSLGPGGTIEAQTEAILFENAIHGADFPQSALACLPEVPWNIPDQEVEKRRDFRGFRVFTIDPPTARDLDDALSVERLDDGNICIGVHIADVSFFVQPDTALDKEAQNRSTSVYLVQKVLPMLPRLLCEELCSLNPGVDRLAFSVVWIMDPAGNILDQWIGRSIICSCAKLTYGHAQGMIGGTILGSEGGEYQGEPSNGGSLPNLHGEHSWQEIIADVQSLHEIARRRRESRFEGGALKLENSKLVFSLDEDGEPYDSMMYRHQDSNFLVEEFMLLANMTVARVISSAFPERSLLRRHPEPNVRKLREFEEFCTKNGFELDSTSSGALHLSLENMRETFQDDPVLFNILMLYATKPMQLAKYFCTGDLKGQEDDWAHYALAVPLYTHFTSPIRRYPDLVVHRTVAAALEAEKVITGHGLMSGKRGAKVGGIQPLQCFSGPLVDKDVSDTDAAQKALGVAAERHKIPEISELSLMAAHCNERRLASRNVKEASDKLYLWSMLKKKQGILSSARVLALGPKFMSLYVCKIGMERRIYYDEIDGLNAEWFEATGTLVLNLSTEKFTYKKYGQTRGRPKRTVADVALLVNPTYSISSNSEEETYEDLIREVEDRLAGKIISEDKCATAEKDAGIDLEVEPAVLPLTLRWFSSVPVSIHAIGGEYRPMDIAVRLYVSSYST